MRSRRVHGFVSVALALATVVIPSVGNASTPPPSAWPQSSLTTPSLDAWPNALRIFGANRYQTGLASALTLRGSGASNSYPYGSPDPTGANAWWGLASCPRAVIVVAGDTPADALAASSLSDATGNSSEPYLRITSSADQVFDPVGDFRRVDTDYAPILLTRSARQGATSLDVATRLAAQQMVSDGCTTAREAIVVGGASAVPSTVDTELVSIGFDRVYRIAGTSRYHTARLIAESLGTAAPTGSPAPTTCTDVAVDDGNARMRFYANSVVEFRDTAETCTLMTRTVVVADGTNGADALAAGWWTSFWQVPVLLHNGSASLPADTQAALQTLTIDNVIVLGGESRISSAVVSEIAALSTSVVTRVSGADRYATSVAMARHLGGWFPASEGSAAVGSLVCIAASSGDAGWPDALSAGPWCGRASGAAANPRAPVRAVTSTTATTPGLSPVVARPALDATPILLVPAGGASLPSVVSDFLTATFDPARVWCTGTSAPGCVAPGFAVVFGGSSSVSPSVMQAVGTAVGGGVAVTSERSPALADTFYTGLDLSPVYANAATTGSVCAPRGAYSQARWLLTQGVTSAFTDVMANGRYQTDADGVARAPGTGSPVCWGAAGTGSVAVRAVSPQGVPGTSRTLDLALTRRFSLSDPLTSSVPSNSQGVDSAIDASAGGSTTWTYTIPSPAQTASVQGTSAPISVADLTIVLQRGTNNAPVVGADTFTASFLLYTGSGVVEGSVAGEAILEAGIWKLRGRATLSGGLFAGTGGFVADVTVGAAGLADDAISWRVDGLA